MGAVIDMKTRRVRRSKPAPLKDLPAYVVRAAMEIDPTSRQEWIIKEASLGLIHLAAGDLREAEAQFKIAMRCARSFREALDAVAKHQTNN